MTETGEFASRLLIIDDDEKLAGLLKDYLETFGYVVDLVHDGTAGLQRAARGNYDAIILDVMLRWKKHAGRLAHGQPASGGEGLRVGNAVAC